jgi:hypothetical protein
VGRNPTKAGAAPNGPCAVRVPPRWLAYVIILGLYLTLRGYHSYDGDQAYRLPLLLHQQDPRILSGDPFVEAFAAFNPHRGSLVVLDLAARPLGLSAGLFALFALTLAATFLGIDRLARAIWPESGPSVGLVAVFLVLAAKAGNIGTNHLFEAMLLDRLMALSVGWLALADSVIDPNRAPWRPALWIALATLVHPSVGLQIAGVLAASRVIWSLLHGGTKVNITMQMWSVIALALAVMPGLAMNIMPGGSVQGEMPDDFFWLLSVELQSPQHMLPHMWRMPQWLAWSCYFALAGLALTPLAQNQSREGESRRAGMQPNSDGARREPRLPRTAQTRPAQAPLARMTIALALVLTGLAVAWYLIEVHQHVRLTIFQPFRMATLARGIALALLAGRLVALWRRGDALARLRAILLPVALTGDWLLVATTAAELAVSAVESIRALIPRCQSWWAVDWLAWLGMIAAGLNFLGRHDTEYGHVPLLATLGVGAAVELFRGARERGRVLRWTPGWTPRRVRTAVVASWFVPATALLVAVIPPDYCRSRWSQALAWGLLNRCRFLAVPLDDIERLAVWCREHTPQDARYIGPPGPKTFRLWSERSLAFNRSASPYTGAGLADWFARFQDHVDFHADPAEFVRAYVTHRHEFESRYQAQSATAKAALAARQGAEYVVAAAPPGAQPDNLSTRAEADPLELLHVEGRYAVYRVRPTTLARRQR